MKKNFYSGTIIVSSLFLSMFLAFMFPIQVSANSENLESISVEDVFPEEEVQQLQERNKNLPIYSDKDENGNMYLVSTRSTGTYPSRPGVILVTDDYYKNLIPTGHAAIVYSSDKVVESLQNGVCYGNNDWYRSKNTCTAVAVSGTTSQQDSFAAVWCSGKNGKPYNFIYTDVDTREKFYCSQLVWAAYKDCYGIDLNTSIFGNAVHPGELVDSSHTYVIYRK